LRSMELPRLADRRSPPIGATQNPYSIRSRRCAAALDMAIPNGRMNRVRLGIDSAFWMSFGVGPKRHQERFAVVRLIRA